MPRWSRAKRSAYSMASRSCGLYVVDRVVVADVTVEVLGDALVLHRRGPEPEAHRTLVELGDAHAGRLAHPHRQDALVVGGVHETVHRPAHLGAQRPHLDGVATLTVGNRDAGHRISLGSRPHHHRPRCTTSTGWRRATGQRG